MTISLNELDDIMQKERNWRDIGGVRENTRAATIMKIVYSLAKEPLTKEGIHRATGVHKGRVLTAALEVATRKNLVFERKSSRRYYSADDPLMTKAYGYIYYLLNWSHPDSKQLFAVFRDHRGWKDNWDGIYFTENIRLSELEKKIGLDKLDFGKLYEAAGETTNKPDKKKEQTIFKEKLKEFNRIGKDAVSTIKKHKARLECEFPNARPGVLTKPIVLDTLIHLKIQGIIPNDTYRFPYVYVDVWERLEKEGLLDFLVKE